MSIRWSSSAQNWESAVDTIRGMASRELLGLGFPTLEPGFPTAETYWHAGPLGFAVIEGENDAAEYWGPLIYLANDMGVLLKPAYPPRLIIRGDSVFQSPDVIVSVGAHDYVTLEVITNAGVSATTLSAAQLRASVEAFRIELARETRLRVDLPGFELTWLEP